MFRVYVVSGFRAVGVRVARRVYRVSGAKGALACFSGAKGALGWTRVEASVLGIEGLGFRV